MKEKLYTLFNDLYATLSNDKSKLSAKRIERMILFGLVVTIVSGYCWIRRTSLTTMEIISICTMLLGFAGFNVVMGNKDKKNENDKMGGDPPVGA